MYARRALPLTLVALAVACTTQSTEVPTTPKPDVTPGDEAPPPAACKGSSALPASGHFTEITAEVGLADVTGVRVAAVDLDGDGRVDLVLHGYGPVRDDVAKGGNALMKRVFMNRGGKFVETTKESGLLDSRDGPGTGRMGHISVFGDVDNDGDLDMFEGTYIDANTKDPAARTDRSEIWLNDGKGHFTMAPQSDVGAKALPTSGGSFADYDRDGVLDLFVGTFYSGSEGAGNLLYRGNGDGTFSDVSTPSGVLRPGAKGNTQAFLDGKNRRPAYGITTCDVNNDGAPDLLVSAYGRGLNELWLNDGKGKFTEVGQGTPFAADDQLDFKSSNEFYHCWCAEAVNAPSCAPEHRESRISCDNYAWNPGYDDQPARLGGNTFTTACGDIDNDGDMDVIHSEIRHWHIGASSDTSQILKNEIKDGKPSFTRVANGPESLQRKQTRSDWNEGDMDVGMFDYDNDGRKDVWLSSSDYPDTWGSLFRQKDDGTFENVTDVAGAKHYHAHGFATVDIDGDGDLDLVVMTSGARCGGDSKCPAVPTLKVYRNDVGASRNFVRIKLEGKGAGGANRAAIGARVSVTSGGVTQVQEVSGGYGHFGLQHDTTLTFGLGATCAIDKIEVRWPDAQGTVETFSQVVSNYTVRLVQGDKRVRYVRPDAK
ncbi:MAG: CRTAC1 family protein [Myxococcales bacterium]|jgi:hypothetical protein|nr:CRTAC1 family protein [Myxococcales bacterium]